LAGAEREQAPEGVPGRLPLSTRILFGVGPAAEGAQNVAFGTFVLFFYTNVLGLSGTWAGTALFLALCIDAVMDPLVGSLSDNWHSRLGRRHPFMYASALPLALCLIALFRPPAGLADGALFGWLLVVSIGVRVSLTLYQIPSAGMIPELTPHYDERTGLASLRVFFFWLGAIATTQLGFLVFFAGDGRLTASRYAGFGVACGGVALLAVLASSLGTHRLIPRLRVVASSPFTVRRFGREIRNVLASPSYRVLLFAALFASVASGFSDSLGLYMTTYFWELSSAQISVLVYGLVPALLLGVVITRPLTERFDKRGAALGLAGFGFVRGPLPIYLRLLGWLVPNHHPALVPLLFVHSMLLVSAAVSILIIVTSMIADVVDENELATGLRQEGLFMATITFTTRPPRGSAASSPAWRSTSSTSRGRRRSAASRPRRSASSASRSGRG
jgi:glycoside/pentoside/hexuronide:cation symporter, GPH family